VEQRAVVIETKDNVATAIATLQSGTALAIETGRGKVELTLRDDIRFGHKFSLARIEAGSDILKYGEVIGTATQVIESGEHVHIHNVVSTRGRGDLAKEEK